MKKALSNTLRAVVSFGLLGYLIYIADFNKIIAVLQGADYRLFGVAMVIFLAALFLFTWRWQILLRHARIYPGYSRLLVFYFIGYFLNNFLPTAIGGDVSRAYYVGRQSRKPATSIGIVLLERITGMLATLTLAGVSLIWASRFFHTPQLIILTITLLGGVILAVFVMMNPVLHRINTRILGKIVILGIGEKINRVLETIHSFREGKMVIFFAYLISLGCQVMLIFMNYLLAISLHLDVSLGYLFLVVPVTFLMGLIPSINGIGVRDVGYERLLSKVGLTSAQGLSLSFLNTMVPVTISLIGGVLFLVYRNEYKESLPVAAPEEPAAPPSEGRYKV